MGWFDRATAPPPTGAVAVQPLRSPLAAADQRLHDPRLAGMVPPMEAAELENDAAVDDAGERAAWAATPVPAVTATPSPAPPPPPASRPPRPATGGGDAGGAAGHTPVAAADEVSSSQDGTRPAAVVPTTIAGQHDPGSTPDTVHRRPVEDDPRRRAPTADDGGDAPGAATALSRLSDALASAERWLLRGPPGASADAVPPPRAPTDEAVRREATVEGSPRPAADPTPPATPAGAAAADGPAPGRDAPPPTLSIGTILVEVVPPPAPERPRPRVTPAPTPAAPPAPPATSRIPATPKPFGWRQR
jgi:hypothetical protein